MPGDLTAGARMATSAVIAKQVVTTWWNSSMLFARSGAQRFGRDGKFIVSDMIGRNGHQVPERWRSCRLWKELTV